VSVKLGLDYQKDDTTTSINYERIQSTNNKAHSYGIEGTIAKVKYLLPLLWQLHCPSNNTSDFVKGY
jgi:hypothetical protein